MSKAIGIQLGRRNSIAAFCSMSYSVEIVTSYDNAPPDRKLMRSVVAYDRERERLLVGEIAYNLLKLDPENVIISLMDLMGRGFSDPVVQQQKSRYAYKITEPTQGTESGIAVWLGGKEYQPEDISAEILKKIVQNTQNYLQGIGKAGEVINQAVITIPAYFNDKQRQATRTAALRAGLTPLELLAEPTAAAISYGYSPNGEDVKTILVYDFGGGTFDASLIVAAGNQFIEHGKAGDLWLGGDDLDTQIIRFVKEEFARQEGLADIDGLIAKMPYYRRVRFQADLTIAVERAKIDLSKASSVRIMPSPIVDELGMTIDIDVELTRDLFEAMIAPLVERSIQICHQALEKSEYPPDMVDAVLLVGGSSQIPFVQRKVKEAFGADKVVVHPRPMTALAEGAAIVAAGLANKILTVSRNYFIKLPCGSRYKVISQGDILPVATSHTFKTDIDGQRLIHLEVFSPDEVRTSLYHIEQDESIGQIWLGLDQYYPSGTEILVNMELDEKSNALTIRATLKNDLSVSVSCTFSRGRSDEKIYRDLKQAIHELNSLNLPAATVEEAMKLAVPVVKYASQIIDPRTGEERLELRDRAIDHLNKLRVFMSKERLDAEYLASECQRVVQLCGSLIPQEQQQRLQKLATQLKKAIEDNNESAIQSLSEDAKRELSNLPDEVNLIGACRMAISQAHATEPTKARAMADKLSRMVSALEDKNGCEAERLWRELQPEVSHWLERELSSDKTGKEGADIRNRAQAALAKLKTFTNQITNNQNLPMSSKGNTPATVNSEMTTNPNSLNPYDILGILPSASTSEITRAGAMAMKRKQHPLDVIAKAQKSLMRAEERIIADYLRPILPTIKRFKYSDLSALEQPEPKLELLSEFDELDGAIAQAAAEESLERLPLELNIDNRYIEHSARLDLAHHSSSPGINLDGQNATTICELP